MNTRKMLKELATLGYVFDRRNSKGIEYFIHEESGAEIRLIANMGDSANVDKIKEAKREAGLSTCDNKRNPAQIRERVAARHAAYLRAQANLERLREHGSAAELNEAAKAIEQAERHFRYWDRLMREAAA